MRHRDPDFLFTDRADLSWDEALRLAKEDRDALAGRMVEDVSRPRLRLDGPRFDRDQPVLRRWTWSVTNTTDGLVLAQGRAMTQRAAYRRRWRAYLRVDAELHAGRGE
jgi:hypothetical protein